MKRIIALVSAIALVILGLGASFMTSLWASDWEDMFNEFSGANEPVSQVLEEGDAGNKIAVVNFDGVIQDTGTTGSGVFAAEGYDHPMTIQALKDIAADDTYSGVLLNVNTPGGGVFESAEIHKYLMEIKESGKTIYSSMGNMAASGGYYVSAPADQIFATDETITGSIGVIMQSMNYTELAENVGISYDVYKSGEMKDMMSASREATDEEQDYLQSIVDTMFQDFVDVVADGRGMSEEQVRELADGRIYLGSEAIENGLVDQEGYFDDALAALKEEVGGTPQVVEIGGVQTTSFPFGVKIQNAIESITGGGEVKMVQELINNRQGVEPMYLYE